MYQEIAWYSGLSFLVYDKYAANYVTMREFVVMCTHYWSENTGFL